MPLYTLNSLANEIAQIVASAPLSRFCFSGDLKFAVCHAEPVRHSATNGPERCEGARGKLREASLLDFEYVREGFFALIYCIETQDDDR